MQVRQVQLGSVIANIARLDNGVEVIPMPEVYMLLGVTQHNVSQHLDNFLSQTDTIPENYREQLKAAGIYPQGRGRPPRLVTKEEFQFLVKKVNTPQAWGVYQALWGMVEQHVRDADAGIPAWASQFQQNMEGRLEHLNGELEHLNDELRSVKEICREHRDELDDLRATLNILISDDDAKTIRTLIQRIKVAHNCDGRKVVGMVRQTLNVGSIYDTPDTRKVINVLRNILGEGLQLVKDTQGESQH